MKKIITIICCFLLMSICRSQNAGSWKKVDANVKTTFHGFVGAEDDYSLAIISKAMAKGATEDPVRIRKYNSDFSSWDDFKLPSEKPDMYILENFDDKIILNGYASGRMVTIYRDITPEQKVMCLSQEGELIGEFKIHTQSDDNSFNGSMDIFPSTDGTKLIMISNEIFKASIPTNEESLTRIFVFDKDFNMIWRDSVNLTETFGKGVLYKTTSFDYTSDGKLLILAYRDGSAVKKMKTQLTIAVHDTPGHEEYRDVKEFEYERCKFNHLLSDDGSLYICGIVYLNVPDIAGNGYLRMFFMKKNIDHSGIEIYNTIELNKVFYKSYPEYSKYLKKQLGPPYQILPLGDGILCCSQFVLAVSGKYSTSYYTAGITLYKFSADGKLEWLKMINKYTQVSTENLFCKAYSNDEDVLIFYADNPENVYPEKPKVYKSKTKLCLVLATVKPDGTITKKILDDKKLHNISFVLPTIYQVNENRYLLQGGSWENGNAGIYLRAFDL
jgi:hypothetical protein